MAAKKTGELIPLCHPLSVTHIAVNFEIPDGVKILVDKQTVLKISGTDKQQVGMVTSEIKSIRPPEPYKGKGIREKGQYVLKKEGKKK